MSLLTFWAGLGQANIPTGYLGFIGPGFIEEGAGYTWIQFAPDWITGAAGGGHGRNSEFGYRYPSTDGWIEFQFWGTGFDLWALTDTSTKSDFTITIDKRAPLTATQRLANPTPDGSAWPYYTSPKLRLGLHNVRLYFTAQPGIYPIFDAAYIRA